VKHFSEMGEPRGSWGMDQTMWWANHTIFIFIELLKEKLFFTFLNSQKLTFKGQVDVLLLTWTL
jgi:hypothetical protein